MQVTKPARRHVGRVLGGLLAAHGLVERDGEEGGDTMEAPLGRTLVAAERGERAEARRKTHGERIR